MAQKKIPARLDVILAQKARKAVVLRRGPAKQVCTIGWNLSGDTFELGQWIEGRIHAYCCDLSADGKYFVYWIMKGHNFQGDYDWTAISRVPYLKAIARWKSSAGLPGGGLFVSDNKCRLHNTWYAYVECDEIIEEPNEPDDDFRYDCRKVYIRRRLRDGWTFNSKVGIRWERKYLGSKSGSAKTVVFESYSTMPKDWDFDAVRVRANMR